MKKISNHFEEYLGHFDGALTFQVFAESGGFPQHMTLDREQAGKRLLDLNRQGMGVFLMVNEGDGKGRSGKNVRRVRAVFADLDDVSLEHADRMLSRDENDRINLIPHMVVETSPGKHHLYWFVDREFPLVKFKRVQQGIIKKLGADKAACDPARVLRVPGFYHQKGEPFPVKIRAVYSVPKYSIFDIIREFPMPEERKAPVVANRKSVQRVTGGVDFSRFDVVSYFQAHGLYFKPTNEAQKHWVRCPWSGEHTDGHQGATDTVIYECNPKAVFHCSHSHCGGRNLQQVVAMLGDAEGYCHG